MLKHLVIFVVCFPCFFALYAACLWLAASWCTAGDAERAAAEQAAWRRRVYAEAEQVRPAPRPAARARTEARPVSNVESAARQARCHGHNCAHDVRPQILPHASY